MMEIGTAQDLKTKVERQIYMLVHGYELQTGLKVDSMYVARDGQSEIARVEMQVKL
jgi:hypothetical protein